MLTNTVVLKYQFCVTDTKYVITNPHVHHSLANCNTKLHHQIWGYLQLRLHLLQHVAARVPIPLNPKLSPQVPISRYHFSALNQVSTVAHNPKIFHTDFMLLCICSLIDDRWYKNVVKTERWHISMKASVSLMFLMHFDIFCDLLLNRPTATWNVFVITQ